MTSEPTVVEEHSNEELTHLETLIADLQLKISNAEQLLFPFEQSLRNKIADLLVEERELTQLYKEQKAAKKEKRLEQKKKGKNYSAPVGLVTINKTATILESASDIQEKKRLYKEAMVHVHPDKFSMQEDSQDIATEITSKLIQIYKTGTLEELQAFHAHIFNGNTAINLSDVAVTLNPIIDKYSYLKKEITRLEKQLKELVERHTYKVLTTYENPMSFVEELIVYFNDRIFKMKKRTRTK